MVFTVNIWCSNSKSRFLKLNISENEPYPLLGLENSYTNSNFLFNFIKLEKDLANL